MLHVSSTRGTKSGVGVAPSLDRMDMWVTAEQHGQIHRGGVWAVGRGLQPHVFFFLGQKWWALIVYKNTKGIEHDGSTSWGPADKPCPLAPLCLLTPPPISLPWSGWPSSCWPGTQSPERSGLRTQDSRCNLWTDPFCFPQERNI